MKWGIINIGLSLSHHGLVCGILLVLGRISSARDHVGIRAADPDHRLAARGGLASPGPTFKVGRQTAAGPRPPFGSLGSSWRLVIMDIITADANQWGPSKASAVLWRWPKVTHLPASSQLLHRLGCGVPWGYRLYPRHGARGALHLYNRISVPY